MGKLFHGTPIQRTVVGFANADDVGLDLSEPCADPLNRRKKPLELLQDFPIQGALQIRKHHGNSLARHLHQLTVNGHCFQIATICSCSSVPCILPISSTQN